MRSLDLSPLLRYSVGFDRLDEMFESAARAGGQDSSYPPYNILKIGEDAYRITLAVAGFTEDDLEIVTKENVLTVRGRASESEPEVQYLHRGIARRAFEHRFQLAEHVRVTGASLESGLLDIDLVREIPEAKKPQTIRIGTGTGRRAIEGKAAAGS
jgi:molecular chaperone IbpA